MPDVDLSTLAAPELRRLLDAARGRGQATLSYQILQEMEARREGGGARARLPGRKRAEPRVIDLNLSDDPLDRWDDPVEAAEPVGPEAEVPAEPEAEPAAALYLERDPPPAAPPRRSRWIGLGLIVGVAVGVPLGLGMGRIIPEPVSPLMVPAESAVAVAAPAAQAPVAVPPAPPPPSAPIPADSPAAAEAPPANALPPAPTETAATTPAPAAPVEEAKEDAPPPPAAAKGCAGASTPADRTICGDPNLQRLQRELRDAYAQALAAHEDRALLREHQLAWRAERDSVSDPEKLAQLYEQRIRKLNAATADAKHQH